MITEKQVEQQRSKFKRIVLAMSSTTRNFAMGCRRRMNEADAKKEESDTKRAKAGPEKGAGIAESNVATVVQAEPVPAEVNVAEQQDGPAERVAVELAP